MACEPISPELALVDPALAFCDTTEAFPMIDSLDPTNMRPPTTNESADTTDESKPSVEALLFQSGAISADQLGELIRDSVLTQRSVASIALERGLTTTEMLTTLYTKAWMAASEIPGQAEAPTTYTAPTLEATPPPVRIAVSPMEPAATAPQAPVAESIAAPTQQVTLEPQTVALEPKPVASLPQLSQPESPDDRIQAAVTRAAPAPLPVPAPIAAPTPQEQTVAPSPAAVATPATASFAVLVRLQTGEQLAIDSAATFESAAELARSLAGRFSRAGEWPLISGRCIRPDAVVSIDIERALES